ncbi:MAG TPA: class I lanthipeptide [Thermoanaerobaculia bacterium]|jgi:hypothetical protein|nr:class I lanthipeptide [Thermoanaerobaculia bacterium]
MKKSIEKHKIEKLKLNRETLRALNDKSLQGVEGGVQTQDRSCILSCPHFC